MEELERDFLTKKLFERTEKTDSCWNWTGAKRNGYGSIKVKGKMMDMHRLSFMLHKGEIPKGIFVCHHCDNPSCVNPDHLFLGTPKDNMQDCLKKGRMKIPEGHKFENGNIPVNRKLTEEQVKEIKLLLKTSKHLLVNEIAEIFNIKRTVVSDIIRGKSYKNII